MLRRLLQRRGGTVERYDYALQRLRGDEGQGLVLVRLRDSQKLRWQTLAKSSGMLCFSVAGVSHHQEALQDVSFAPGKTLVLIREPENPYDANAVAVWNKNATKQVGHVPKEYSEYVSGCLAEGKRLLCISMWETVKEGRRVALRILVVGEGVNLDSSEIT
jgi:hypothetical protein